MATKVSDFTSAPLYVRKPTRSQRREALKLLDGEQRRKDQTRAAARQAAKRGTADLQPQQAQKREAAGRQLRLALSDPGGIPNLAEEDFRRLQVARRALSKRDIPTLVPLLPLFFQLRGEPYHLREHLPFEPFYRTQLPQNMIWKTGRQVAKSSNQASQGVLLANLIPYFDTLFITPQFELIRRFSTNYVRPFIETSPMRNYLVDRSCTNSVLQRSFRNGSIMHFTFAFHDVGRARGIPSSRNCWDEFQDMDPDFPAIINESMSFSPWKICQYTGTPKTLENPMETTWNDSSQAEWAIPCECGKLNIPSLDADLDKMLGPFVPRRAVSETEPGLVCAKCNRPLDASQGSWWHRRPQLRYQFAGYHVPQCILPVHYAHPREWAILQAKRQGFGRVQTNTFYNECCGESYDTGVKLLSITDLKRAASLHENNLDNARRVLGNYVYRILAVDWGGGGEDWISFTAAAVLGLRPDGRIDVIYGWRSPTPNDPAMEAVQLLTIMQELKCCLAVHDFGGAGGLRELLLLQGGLPADRCLPISYQRVNVGDMMVHHDYNPNTGKRDFYTLDKARSLQYVCGLIRHQRVRTFSYDFKSGTNPGLLHDFLSLVEDKIESRAGQAYYTIIRNKLAGPDDFAHAVTMGVCSLCYINDSWPSLSDLVTYSVDPQALREATYVGNTDWNDIPAPW